MDGIKTKMVGGMQLMIIIIFKTNGKKFMIVGIISIMADIVQKDGYAIRLMEHGII